MIVKHFMYGFHCMVGCISRKSYHFSKILIIIIGVHVKSTITSIVTIYGLGSPCEEYKPDKFYLTLLIRKKQL